MFDKGATTFDLQDTTFNDCQNIFRYIRNSHYRYLTADSDMTLDNNGLDFDD